jgi:hypothetical protein
VSERVINVDHGVTTPLQAHSTSYRALRVIDRLRLIGARLAVRYEQ